MKQSTHAFICASYKDHQQFIKGNVYGTSSEVILHRTKYSVCAWQDRQHQKTEQNRSITENAPVEKIKSHSDTSPVNFNSCRTIQFFRLKRIAVDISVNRFYYTANEPKWFYTFSFSCTDILLFHIFTLLSLA